MIQSGGPGDIYALVNGGDPGRARIGNDDARRSQNGNATQYTETGVPGLGGQLFAVIDGYRDFQIECASVCRRQSGQIICDHLPGGRVDGRFPDGQGQPRFCHRPDARSGFKSDSAAAFRDFSANQRPMGNVGIVAGILDDARHGSSIGERLFLQGECGYLAAGQCYLHQPRKFAGNQRCIRGFRSGGGAGAGGPAVP